PVIISNYFDSGSHMLRPFTTDPNIIDTVTGFSNETRIVAAPFLSTKNDTGIERDVFAKRPGIEFILRLRLKEQNTTTVADSLNSIVADLLNSIFGEESGEDISVLSNTEIAEVVAALLNKEGSTITSGDILERLK